MKITEPPFVVKRKEKLNATKHWFFRSWVRRFLQMLGLWKVNHPNFFVLGVQKAGTTTLHNQLQTHPSIVGPIELKECHFFDTITELTPENIAAYSRDFYPKWFTGMKLTFESTPRYIFHESALALLKEFSPTAKFILVLREPAERAFSQWSMRRWNPKRKAHIKPKFPTFDDVISDLTSEFVTRGYYASQLRVFLKYFEARQLHIIDFSELINRNSEVMESICEFLGLPNHDFQLLHHHKRLKDVQHQYEDSMCQLREHYEPKNAELKLLLSDIWGVQMSWLD